MAFPNTPTQAYLEDIKACRPAREFVGEATLPEAWEACTRLSWLRYVYLVQLERAHWDLPLCDDYQRKQRAIYAPKSCDEFRAAFACPTI